MKYKVKRHTPLQPTDTSVRLIPLTQGKNAVVDAAAYDWLMQWNWSAHKLRYQWYAYRSEITKGVLICIAMHRAILNTEAPEVDHCDGDGLNNRRSNLRECTVAQNQWNARMLRTNTSGYKGVSFDRRRSKWTAQASHNNKHIYLGSFSTPADAAVAYQTYCRKERGDFYN